MNYAILPAGRQPPQDIYAVIEIPAQADPIKYEVNKEYGVLMVDRFMPAPMFYPANYGFIPGTSAGDGDPLDVLVVTPNALMPGSMIRCRPVGVLQMHDEAGEDAKIIALPHRKVSTAYAGIEEVTDLPELLRNQIIHFFTYYKTLESGKWVKIDQWAGREAAEVMIRASLPK